MMNNIIRKALLSLIALLGLFRICQCMAGQDYVVTNDQLIPLEVEGMIIDFSHLETIGRQHLVNGSLIILDDLDDDNFGFTVEMYTSPNGDGDYKKMAMDVPRTQVCEGFKKFYKEFVQPSFTYGENSNIPYIDDDGLCPIPAGEYYIKEIEFNTDAWPNQMPRGTLKVVVTFFKGDDVVGGLTALLKIEDDTR
ncbi:uncharacterized protein LOC119600482 isoform X2 [Lucilia sericata]|uniref:uncharacterized protein LOC119600482 isoform X2 n=1 Tax=Lucilia sericata TaxID=13632 RepID=UPI0018A827D2|nr:uncharacterized protein LOC119600482 isoform X2 [Lucilia sericata]